MTMVDWLQTRIRVFVLLVIGATSLAGTWSCFDPDLGTRPCAPDGWCPNGQLCGTDNICRANPVRDDGGPPPDIPPPMGPSLRELLPSVAELSPAFNPDESFYALNVSSLVQSIHLTAVPENDGDVIRINNADVPPGQPSPPLMLTGELTMMSIVVSNPDEGDREYRVVVSRVAQLTHDRYGKGSNPGTGEYLGWSADISQNLLAIGAPDQDSIGTGDPGQGGSVYVFSRQGGTWMEEAQIRPGTIDGRDEFGQWLSMDKDTLAIGAYADDSGATGINGSAANVAGKENSGAVYVYRRRFDGNWQQEAYIKSAAPDQDDEFGLRFALSGDVLAVGVPLEDAAVGLGPEDNSQENSGAVYIFRRSETTWEQEAYLKADNGEAGDEFGYSLAFDGNVLFVSARGEAAASGADADDNTAPSSGAVYVFTRNNQSWEQSAYIKAPNADAGDQFGYRVVVGKTGHVTIGARYEDSAATGSYRISESTIVAADNSAEDSGAVYVFRQEGNVWQPFSYIKASNTSAGDQFGRAISAFGDVIAVGSPKEDSSSSGIDGLEGNDNLTSAGAVYIFHCGSETCEKTSFVKASNPGEVDNFGQSVALSGDTLVVGAPYEDSSAFGFDGDQENQGRDDSGAFYILW